MKRAELRPGMQCGVSEFPQWTHRLLGEATVVETAAWEVPTWHSRKEITPVTYEGQTYEVRGTRAIRNGPVARGVLVSMEIPPALDIATREEMVRMANGEKVIRPLVIPIAHLRGPLEVCREVIAAQQAQEAALRAESLARITPSAMSRRRLSALFSHAGSVTA